MNKTKDFLKKTFIRFDNNGNIISLIETNDPSLVIDNNTLQITNNIDKINIVNNPKKYKVFKIKKTGIINLKKL